jgi:hypothetical protein
LTEPRERPGNANSIARARLAGRGDAWVDSWEGADMEKQKKTQKKEKRRGRGCNVQNDGRSI